MKTIAVAILSLFSITLFAQTNVSGGIFQNTTWSLSGSPYIVTGSIVVFPGKTLTIEPGVEVLVTPDYSFNTGNLRYIEIRGALVAIGTDQAPITFKSAANDSVGLFTWMGINIKGSQGGTVQMDRFKLFDSFYGLYNDIAEQGVTYNFTNCHFRNNNYSIQLNADMNYSNCLFENNGVGQAAQIVYGSLTANNCQFFNNFCSFTWSNNIQVANCLFQGNGNNIVGSPGTVTDCQFIGNQFAFAEANSHNIQNCYFASNGVAVDNTGSCTINNSIFENNNLAIRIGDNSTITNCEITYNQIGIAVNASNPSTTNISDNIICSNAQYNLENSTDKNFQVNANCFCSQDSSVIESFIFDGYDDITRGLVNYAIYDDSCDNILSYVVKVLLDNSSIEELTESNAFQVVSQNGTSVTFFAEKNLTIGLVNLSGQLLKTVELSQGKQEVQFPFNSGVYLITDFEGRSTRILF
jgi:hypothetical protein